MLERFERGSAEPVGVEAYDQLVHMLIEQVHTKGRQLWGQLSGAPVPALSSKGAAHALIVGIAGLALLVWASRAGAGLGELVSSPILWLWVIGYALSQRLHVQVSAHLNISFEEVYLIPILLVLPIHEAGFVLGMSTLLILAAGFGGRWGWTNCCYTFAVLAPVLVLMDLAKRSALGDYEVLLLAPLAMVLIIVIDLVVYGSAVAVEPARSLPEFLSTVMPTQLLQLVFALPLATLATLAAMQDQVTTIVLLFVPFVLLRTVGIRMVQASNLEAAAQARAKAMRVAAHELRTPLTTISGFAQMMTQMEMSAEQREQYLQIVVDQGERMQTIIEDLLVYSSLTSDPTAVHIEEIELLELAERARDAVDGAGRIEVHVPAGLDVRADQTILERALINLLANACKYAPEGPILLRAHGSASGEVSIEVWDEGPGVPEKFVPRLFEEFARSDEAMASDQTGTGLGLAIVRTSMQLMGGDVTYRARANRNGVHGSIFALRVPAER